MQNAAKYREFAETLIAAAKDCGEETREAVLAAAAAWTALAEAEERTLAGETNVVDLAAAQRRLRAATP